MNLCVTVEGSPRVNALPSSSSSTWPEMSNKSNPVSLLPHLVQSIKSGRVNLSGALPMCVWSSLYAGMIGTELGRC